MRRKFGRTLAAVMAAALTVSLMGTADAEAAKKIKLSKKSITVTKGKTKTVTVKNVKAKKVKKLTVKSSKKKIATVKKSGKTKIKVKGKKAGSAKVTVKVTLKGKKKATKLTLKVKVKNAAKKKTTTTPPAAPATTAPAGQATTAPGGQQGGQATDQPNDQATDKPGDKATDKPGDPTKVPGTPTPNPWDGYEKSDPAANVTLKYNDNVKSEENPNGGKLEGPDKILFKDGEGYPESGIDLMKYDRVIVKVAATAELTGDGSWYGKLGLNSSDSDYTGLGAYDDGFGTPKYMNDVKFDNGYVVQFAIPGDIDQETWSPAEISQYADAINMQLANADEYANLTVKEIAFESDKQPSESDKPDESAKPSGDPGESAKPSGDPGESAKPSGDPGESAKPSGDPGESAKPSGDPGESAKPSGDPGESAKPSDEPSPTPLPAGEKEIEGVVCKAYELDAAKDYAITVVKADGSKETTELPLTELPNLLNKITDVVGTYEKWMDTQEYTKTVNGVTFEVATADEDQSGVKQITVSGSTNTRLNGEFEVSVAKTGAVYEATITKAGSTEPTRLTITDGSDAVVVTGTYNGTDYRMTTAKDKSGIKVYTDDAKLFAQIVKTDAGYELDLKKEEVEKRGLAVAPSTKKDPQQPTPTPVPTPTPEGKLDLSKADVWEANGNAANDLTADFNDQTGCLDVTIPNFTGIIFRAPDNGKTYKYVRIVYTGDGANTVESFDSKMEQGAQGDPGTHEEAALGAAAEQKSVVYAVSDAHEGGCLKAIKLTNVDFSANPRSVALHIKSIEFSENAFPVAQVSAQLALAPEAVIAGGKANAAATVDITGTDAEPNITWTSSNDEVATVTADANDPKKAVVTSVAAGTAEITVTVAVDGKTATDKKTITVEEKLSITGEGTVKCDKTPVGVGDEALLSVDGLVIKGAKTTTTTWAIADECKDLATIDAATGKITGVAAGTVKVTATVAVTGALGQNDTKTVSGEIAVSAAPQPTIEATVTLTKSAIIAEGTTAASAVVTVTGSDDEQKITWSSSNEAVATVAAAEANSKNAVVTGVAAGTAEIRVTVKVGETEKTFKADIEVKAKLTATGGAITVPEGPLFAGKTAELKVAEGTITTNGTISKTEWAVAEADQEAAEINKDTGVLTVKKAGATVNVTATVTVTGELDQTEELTINGTVQTAPAGLLDLSEASSVEMDGQNTSKMSTVYNEETGCLDVAMAQFSGVIFKAPDDGNTYKFAKITYTSDGAVKAYTFDESIADGGHGQNPNGQKESDDLAQAVEEKTTVYQLTSEHTGTSLTALKFVDLRFSGSVEGPNLHIKSVEFLTELSVDLSAVTGNSDGIVTYNAQNGLTVNDNSDKTTELYCPIPYGVKIAPGQKVKVTISGSQWGGTDFRIWTTPKDALYSGDYVVSNSVFLAPTIEDDGSFAGTVEITAKGKECDYLTLKPSAGGKIQNLVITDIKVDLVFGD